MAKMRVHELAKELNIKSQDIIDTLSTTDFAVKSASSGVEDAAQDVVRKKFGKKQEPKAAEKKPAEKKPAEKKPAENKSAEKKPAEKKTEDGKERPKKKSSISAVFNAQYSKQSRRQGGGRGNNGNGNNGGGNGNGRGQRRDNSAKPQQHSIIRPRPVGERAMRPISERTAGNNDSFEETQTRQNQPAKTNSERQNNRTRNANNNGANRNENRGDRQQRQGQGQSQGQERGKRQERTERGGRNFAERGERQERGGNNRPQNDRNERGDRNSRGGNNRPQNERNERGGRGGRFNKENTQAAAPEETRSKEGRGGNDRRNNNNNHRKDHDRLGGKKQENYINLEKHGGRKKPQPQPKPKEDEDVIKTITLPEKMTIRELADRMKIQPSVIVKKLFLKGQMVTVNQEVDFETAEEIALEFNYICEAEEKIDVIAELLKEDEEKAEDMVARPPVVCVMGHVDHGKTSLLDAIRSTRVTDREAGGITQHIGASVVSINGQNITFLDTPGHEAFTAMRMRGANSTDIAILVVAADDGVMPQTVEAINHARAAGVEIIVAVNKIDKPSANIEKVKQELSEYELIPEDWGGSTVFCPVSAHTGEGIDNLLEMILLTAEVLELRANPNRNARGLVIEAQLDKGRGAVATVLVQKGTLHVGDSIACGSSYGKVRAMIDDKGARVKKAIPSTPVEILGLNSVPAAGETFVVCDSDKEAKSFADTYIAEEKNRLIEDTKAKMSLDDLFSQIQSGNMKELDIIVKADVQGSVEAVKQSLVKLSNDEVVVKVIHGGVGAINESDVILASASNAIIIGFNVRPDPIAKVTADNEGVDVRLYKVIYNAIEDVEAAMKGMLDPIFEEKVIGHAEIRQIFKASGVGNIAGSYVLDGTIERGCKVRISRAGEQIFEGDLASLKRFKDDVKEVSKGFECGLVFDGFNDIEELDVVEAYKMVEVPR
jgi:translation initiation factor IF-2